MSYYEEKEQREPDLLDNIGNIFIIIAALTVIAFMTGQCS